MSSPQEDLKKTYTLQEIKETYLPNKSFPRLEADLVEALGLGRDQYISSPDAQDSSVGLLRIKKQFLVTLDRIKNAVAHHYRLEGFTIEETEQGFHVVKNDARFDVLVYAIGEIVTVSVNRVQPDTR